MGVRKELPGQQFAGNAQNLQDVSTEYDEGGLRNAYEISNPLRIFYFK